MKTEKTRKWKEGHMGAKYRSLEKQGGRTGSKDGMKAKRRWESSQIEENIEAKTSEHSRTEEVKSNQFKRDCLTGESHNKRLHRVSCSLLVMGQIIHVCQILLPLLYFSKSSVSIGSTCFFCCELTISHRPCSLHNSVLKYCPAFPWEGQACTELPSKTVASGFTSE